MTKYVCALSGLRATDEEIVDEEFPDGWIELTINRKYVNPKWEAIQYVKQGLVAQYLQPIPEEQREEQVMALTLQVEAQFASLEMQTEKWSEDVQTLYVANPDDNPALMAEYNKFRKMLGLPAEVRLDEELPEESEELEVEQPTEKKVEEKGEEKSKQ
jgi:hypothetical protein